MTDCQKQVINHKRGFCVNHYHRWRRHGDPLKGSASWGAGAKFLKEVINSDTDDCIFWPYGKNGAGYGTVRKEGDRCLYLVHRLVCIEVHGEPTENKPLAMHECNNGHLGCCNPKHLQWGDDKDNAYERKSIIPSSISGLIKRARPDSGDGS